MKNQYLKKWLTLSALVLLVCFSPHMLLRAQSTANYAFSTNTTGSLVLDMNGNTVDMSTGTTQVLATNTSQDQAINATAIAFPAGFDFFFEGTRFNSYFATSNGVVQLGSTAVILGSTYTAGGGTLAAPRFSAFDGDLGTGTTGGIFGKLIGSGSNRCYVIEFRNMNLMWNTYTNDGTYQVRFYESTGVVEYVYGTMFCNTTINAGDATPEVGFSWGSSANQSLSITLSTLAVDLSGTMVQNTVTAGTNITNLNSAADGSRRIFRFTPPVPTAPSGLTFTAVTGTTMTLNWTDNATNELGYAVYRSTDGINYTYLTQTAANSSLYNATGLSFGTTYYWKVYALTEGALSTPALSGTQTTLLGTLSGIKTVGSGGDYNNLTIAFNAINAQGLAGDVELQLITGYPATAETYPIQSSNTASVGVYNVKVYPTVSGLSITSANTTGTLNLNNAKNLTFDGRVNQTGANDLVIANTNAGTSYAILFNNDAQNNAIKNAIVQSANTSASSGTIFFGTTTGANGNDNNTIDNCDIKDGATTPLNAIYSVGSTGTSAQFNDNITISNNRISNFFSAGSATVGIFAGGGNSTWTISNNKLFQTATRTYTTGNTHNGIQVSNTSGNGFVITGNTIGFASSTGTGVYTLAGATTTRFIGINISAGTTTTSSVQGNTISGFSLATSSGATTANGVFAGINITNGNVNVGNSTPNIIGAATGTGAITATPSSTGGLVVGINSSSAGTVNLSNNIIGSLTANGSGATISASITGIQVTAGTPTINGNTIGSTTTANSINSPTVATAGSQLIRGIDVTSGVSTATSIQSNTIANLNQSGTTTGANIRGISYAGSGLATISLNTIYNLSGANANIAVSGGATGIQGILHTGSATTGAIINKNTIYTLSATNTGAVQTNVAGIGYSNPTTGSVTNNTIYDLRNASTMAVVTTPPTVSGILVRALGTSVQISNNMISLGDVQTTNTQFIGIWNSFSTVGSINIYHNSVSISGTASAGALPSFGLLRGDNSGTAVTTPVDIRNNIFSNIRSGGTGKHYAIANQATAASATGWGLNASNYNLLNTASTATVGLWGSTDETFNAWRTASASDVNSFSGVPLIFVNVPTGNLHLNMGSTATPIESGGATIAAVTTDIDNQNRPGPSGSVNGGATAPDLGADEFDGVPALPVITLNSVTPPTTTQCTSTPRVVSVNVTTPVGIIINVSMAYTVNGVAQSPITMTNSSGTTWTGTIPAPTPTNAVIAWGIAATNSSGLSGSYTGTPYSDEPLFGITGVASASTSVVCVGSPSVLTASINPSTQTYTAPTAVTNPTVDEDLGNITITQGASTILNNTTSRNSLTGTIGTATGTAGSYSNFTSFGPYNITSGQTYNFSLTALQDVTAYSNALAIYIDYNRNGVFTDAGEQVYVSGSTTAGGHTETGSFTVPATALFGNTRMRVISNEGSITGSTMTVAYGEFEEYTVSIVPSGAQSITWMNGATTVGTGSPLTVSPTTTTTYTAVINYGACSVNPSPTVTVTVNPLPTAPTATNSAQCGDQIPTASVSSTTGLPTPTFKWYLASSGGTASQTSTSTTFTSSVATTTTYYVSELNTTTGCESARTAVTVNVSTPDQVAVVASPTSFCLGSSVTLTASNTNPTPFQSYTYSFQSATTGSGAVTAVSGNPATITPTAAGTFVYTVTAVDGGCAATNTVSVIVKALPVISTATATPTTVCSGDPITLTGASVVASAGTATVGTQSSTDLSSSIYRLGFGAGDFRHQLLFTAAELNAAGIQAGNITSIAFNVTSVGSGTANNYTIKLGNTTATAVTTTFLTDPTATAYTAATYTPVSGVNTHTFSTPFNWNGTSNVLVDICYNVSAIGGSSTVAVSTPAATSNVGLLGTVGACTATTGSSTFALRPLATFGGQVGTSFTSGLTWNWTPGGFNTPVASTSISNSTGSNVTQAFTVTATNTTTGCSNTVTTAPVTIRTALFAPTAVNSTQCGQGVPTASVTGSGAPGNTFSWYLVSSGGTAISGQTGSSLSGYSISATTTFYVAENNGTCTGPRVAVVATVTPAPTISVSGTATICNGSASALTASSSNDPNYTYTWTGGLGTGATVSASPSANTTYTVTATDVSGGANNGCVTSATYSIAVNPTPSGVTANASATTICEGTSVNLTSTGVANTTVPFSYTQGFESWPPTGWTFINAGTGNQWGAGTTAHSGSGAMMYTYNSSAAANAWGITPSQSMIAGTTYTISFWYKVESGTFPEKMKVTIGNAATVAAQTTTLWNNNGGANLTNTTYAQGTVTYTPATSGTYYLAFNCYSDLDEYLLHVDDISITANVPATPTFAWTSSPAGYTSSAQNPTGVAPITTTTYTVAVSNSFGCSATASKTVTVNHPSTNTLNQTACSSYTYNGTTYTASGTYVHHFTNAVGCDSAVTLNLTINQPTTSTLTQSACSSYTLNGTTYTASGTYVQHLTNAAGCDSAITLNLIIKQPTTSTLTASGCSSYTLNGSTYTSSGTYVQHLTNAAGCDSAITLTLTINQPTTATVNGTGCNSFTYNGTTYNMSGTYTQTLMNAAGCDSVVTVNVALTNSFNTINATACSSYTLNGTTYNASGTYTQLMPGGNSTGCDSTIILNLTINQPTTSTLTASACSSYTLNGTSYTSSGTYTQLLTGANAHGCDSTITLNLTINQPTTSTLTASACSSYTLNGTSYTSSGTYTQFLAGANSHGCDSTITLNLTINQPTTSTLTTSGCSSYTLNGTSYTSSGTYTQVLAGANAHGCDSTITLNLTINQPTASTTTITQCGGTYTWTNGTTYNTSGTHTQTLMNAAGCDSIATLNLTINQPTASTTTITQCGGTYTWTNGTTYNTSGTHTQTLMNAAGCDSIATLNLTINQPTANNITAVNCSSFTLNGTTYTASGTYVQHLTNAAGCDSAITLSLTITQPTTSTTTITQCGGTYTWTNGVTYNTSGTHTQSLFNAAGCDSTATLVLTINALPVATATVNSNATITASSGNSYQWINCTTGLAVPGATAQTFVPSANGNYAVVISNGSGCADTSACVTVNNVGIMENTSVSIAVFPNPTHNEVTVTMDASSATIEVVDAQGKLLQTTQVISGGKVDLSTYETGVYFLRITTEYGSTLERIVKN